MIELVGSQVALRPIFDPDQIGHIIIPDAAKNKSNQGIVKYVGPKVRDLKPGDHCLYSGYSGGFVSLEDEGLLCIMAERYVVAIMHPPHTEVPGLYFQDSEGTYFQATYEMAIEIIGQAVQNSDWYKTVKNGKRMFSVNAPRELALAIDDDED